MYTSFSSAVCPLCPLMFSSHSGGNFCFMLFVRVACISSDGELFIRTWAVCLWSHLKQMVSHPQLPLTASQAPPLLVMECGLDSIFPHPSPFFGSSMLSDLVFRGVPSTVAYELWVSALTFTQLKWQQSFCVAQAILKLKRSPSTSA